MVRGYPSPHSVGRIVIEIFDIFVIRLTDIHVAQFVALGGPTVQSCIVRVARGAVDIPPVYISIILAGAEFTGCSGNICCHCSCNWSSPGYSGLSARRMSNFWCSGPGCSAGCFPCTRNRQNMTVASHGSRNYPFGSAQALPGSVAHRSRFPERLFVCQG